jgi:hypothetical protein
MPVTYEEKPPGIPATEMRVGQLAKVVAHPVESTLGRVFMLWGNDLVEVGGDAFFRDLSHPIRPEDTPRVEILPNGSTLTVTGNE